MTEQEKITSERYRGIMSKIALTSIYEIYDKYNGTTTKNCWCSSSSRKSMSSKYYIWYDNKIQEICL